MGVEFQVFPLTLIVVLTILWHYRARVWCMYVCRVSADFTNSRGITTQHGCASKIHVSYDSININNKSQLLQYLQMNKQHNFHSPSLFSFSRRRCPAIRLLPACCELPHSLRKEVGSDSIAFRYWVLCSRQSMSEDMRLLSRDILSTNTVQIFLDSENDSVCMSEHLYPARLKQSHNLNRIKSATSFLVWKLAAAPL